MEICNETTYKAYLYLRLSKEDDVTITESNSIINQRILALEFVKLNPDIEIVGEFFDDGFTGTNYDRPGFQNMLDSLNNGSANCVIIKDLSRLGRDYIQTGEYIENIFPKMNVRLIAINDNIDTLSTSQIDKNLVIPIKNLINDSYCRDLSIKLRNQFKIQRSKGEFISPSVFFGYKRSDEDRHKLVPDEVASTVVKYIFSLSLKGYSNQKIADFLNTEGIPSPLTYKIASGVNFKSGFTNSKESKWGYTSIERILTNKIYLGTLEQGKRSTPNYKIKKTIVKHEDDWDIIENAHDPIIEKSVFDTIQRIKKRDTRIASDGCVTPLSGILFCADCNSPVYIRTVKRGDKKFNYFVCSTYKKGKGCSSHSFKAEILEEIILKALNTQIEEIIDLKNLSLEVGVAKLQYSKKKKLDFFIKSKENEIEEKKSFKMKLYETKIDGIITDDEYVALKSDYNQQIDELNSQLINLKQELKNVENGFDENNSWMEFFIQQQGKLDKLQRDVVVMLVDKILLYKDKKIEILFNFKNEYEYLYQIAIDTFAEVI